MVGWGRKEWRDRVMDGGRERSIDRWIGENKGCIDGLVEERRDMLMDG